MKSLKTTLRNLLRPALLAVAALSLLASSSRAASITLETKVPGYSSAGWILVVPELRNQLGGRVRYDPARGRWVTDRVARGENMRISILPTTAQERRQRIALTGVGPRASEEVDLNLVLLPYVNPNFRVSLNPAYDNVDVNVVSGPWRGPWTLSSLRIPIGTRP